MRRSWPWYGASMPKIDPTASLRPQIDLSHQINAFCNCGVQNSTEIRSLDALPHWFSLEFAAPHHWTGNWIHRDRGFYDLAGSVMRMAVIAMFPRQTYPIPRGIVGCTRPNSISAPRSRTGESKIQPKPLISPCAAQHKHCI